MTMTSLRTVERFLQMAAEHALRGAGATTVDDIDRQIKITADMANQAQIALDQWKAEHPTPAVAT